MGETKFQKLARKKNRTALCCSSRLGTRGAACCGDAAEAVRLGVEVAVVAVGVEREREKEKER